MVGLVSRRPTVPLKQETRRSESVAVRSSAAYSDLVRLGRRREWLDFAGGLAVLYLEIRSIRRILAIQNQRK